MSDKYKTKEQLITKLVELRHQIADLKKLETKHKKAEGALHESEQWYRVLVETMNESLAIMNENMLITRVNDNFCKMLGYTQNELIGRPGTDLHDETNQRILKKQFTKRKQVAHDTYEIAFTGKDGQQVFAIISPKPLFDAEGRFKGSFALATDITKRKQDEEALKESEERYRDLVEKADIAIVIDDEEGNFKYFNKKFAELFGYSEKDMRKQSIRTLVHPEDLRWVLEFHKARFYGGKIPSRYEFKGVRKDGSTIYLELDVIELKEEKRTIGTRSYIWDITERKMAEEVLRENEEKFRSMLVNTSDAIISINTQGKIVFWNPAAENIFGYSSKNAIGKPYEITLPKRLHPVSRKNFKQLVFWKKLGIIEKRMEMIGLRKDGGEFPMEISVSSWNTREGIFFSGIIRDITEPKKATDEFRKANSDLKRTKSQYKKKLTSI